MRRPSSQELSTSPTTAWVVAAAAAVAVAVAVAWAAGRLASQAHLHQLILW